MTAATIDEYLAGLPEDKRAALQRLREQIQAAAPDALEAISYDMPAFKLGGRWFVGFAATKKHRSSCAAGARIEAHAEELAGYRLRKGTISFVPDQPLQAELVNRLVLSRASEYGARWSRPLAAQSPGRGADIGLPARSPANEERR